MPLKTRQDALPELNLTPMIDVLFLLIIFFMVGAKFTDERQIRLQVPKVGQTVADMQLAERRVINVLQDGRILLDDQAATLDELTSVLRQQRAEHGSLRVAVRGDAAGAFQHVAAVLAACRTAGISDLAISVSVTRR
jgi:biopolymer transport protein ExbD